MEKNGGKHTSIFYRGLWGSSTNSSYKKIKFFNFLNLLEYFLNKTKLILNKTTAGEPGGRKEPRPWGYIPQKW